MKYKGKGRKKSLEFWFVACWCEFVELMSLASQMKKKKKQSPLQEVAVFYSVWACV